MRRTLVRLACVIALACTSAFAAPPPAFDPKPWLEDLAQVRDAMQTGYANLDWAVQDREAKLPALFDEAADRIRAAKSDGDARAALERFGRRIGDGHIAFLWPSGGSNDGPAKPCDSYDAAMAGQPVAANMPGYQPLPNANVETFPAGLITIGNKRVGVIRIGLFMPQAWPSLCAAALKALAIPQDKPCDDACGTRIYNWAHTRMTADLAAHMAALKAAGAQVLLIDTANNSGGSEWAEAAAQMLTNKPLKAERVDFVRSKAWADKLKADEAELRGYAVRATGAEQTELLALADQIHAKAIAAATPCDGSKFWRGETPDCAWRVEGFYATGLLAHADAAKYRGKPYAATVYSPAQYPFTPALWTGPLVVLIDRNSYSAAEEFAAVLQDNHAALIVGEPTGGAGCGHMIEGLETKLKNSGGTFQMPDCTRIRADGTNEIRGIQPDILIGFTPRDGAKLKARRLFDALARVLPSLH